MKSFEYNDLDISDSESDSSDDDTVCKDVAPQLAPEHLKLKFSIGAEILKRGVETLANNEKRGVNCCAVDDVDNDDVAFSATTVLFMMMMII